MEHHLKAIEILPLKVSTEYRAPIFKSLFEYLNLAKTIINVKLTYCRLFKMILHCLLSHLKASFHLFTAQQRVGLNMKYINNCQIMSPLSVNHFL